MVVQLEVLHLHKYSGLPSCGGDDSHGKDLEGMRCDDVETPEENENSETKYETKPLAVTKMIKAAKQPLFASYYVALRQNKAVSPSSFKFLL